MPDSLTPEERAAIAAFPEEKVYRCRRGESGIPLHGIPLRVSMQQSAARARRNAVFARNRQIDQEIRNLWNKGLTDKQISKKVKLNVSAIAQRRSRMGATRG